MPKRTVLISCILMTISSHATTQSTPPQQKSAGRDALTKIITDAMTPRETRDEQALEHLKAHATTTTAEALTDAVKNDLTKTVLYLATTLQNSPQINLSAQLPGLIKIAIEHYHVPIVQTLVNLQAQTGEKDAYTTSLFTLLTAIEKSNNQLPLPPADEQKRQRDNQLQILLFFVDRGANVNARIPQGKFTETPLSLAARNGDLQPVEFLVSRGALVAPPDNLPLLHAIDYQHPEVVKFLLKKGALVNQPQVGTVDVGQETFTTKKYPLIAAINTSEPDLTIVTDLMNARADLNVRGRLLIEELTPLIAAIQGGHEKIAALLVERGADLPEIVERRPLVQAVAYFLMPDLLAQILKRQAPIVTEKKTSMTPLHEACKQWSISSTAPDRLADVTDRLARVADLLIKNGVDINARDNLGNTALHYAISSRWPAKTLTMLMSYKPDVTIKNNNNETPLDLARKEHEKGTSWDEHRFYEQQLRNKRGTTAPINDEDIRAAHQAAWDQIIATIKEGSAQPSSNG